MLLWSCHQSTTKHTKTIDFDAFSIETTISWHQFKERGIDSYVGGIAIDKTETLYFDLGWYSNTLTETEIK